MAKKNQINKSDYDRVLVTETLPFETPMIFSSDGLYRLVKQYDRTCRIQSTLVSSLVTGTNQPRGVNSTIPFVYKIKKGELGHRELGLMHPNSQWKVRKFYEKYEHLLLYHCSSSPASIRAPAKVSGSYYLRSGLKLLNQYKSSSIMNESLDELTLNTPSFFAYRGVSRLYKYFESRDFFRTEKKYDFMATLDVSHCFPSIYTHGMSWALKGKGFTKKHVSVKSTFSQEFDELMRHMNFGETNGILVGPEVSRVFAEIIFQTIDEKAINRINKEGQRFGVHYTFRRYVDDVYIFANSKETIELVSEVFSDEMSKQNLYLNVQKSDLIRRPFVTNKSKLINRAKAEASSFMNSFSSPDSENQLLIPNNINSTWKLTRAYLTRVKSLCSDSGVEYGEVSGFLIGFFCERVKKLVSIEKGTNIADKDERTRYYKAILVILEIQFFLYQVSPSVQSSYKFCTSLILIIRFCKNHLQYHLPDIEHRVYELAEELMLEMQDSRDSTIPERVLLEKINVILAISELKSPLRLTDNNLKDLFCGVSSKNYFTIVSGLYYLRDNSVYDSMKKEILKHASAKLADLSDLLMSSEKAHLLLDLLTCPYIPEMKKKKWIVRAFSDLEKPPLTNAELNYFFNNLDTFQSSIDWKNLDLLNSLERKELKSNY